MQASTPAARQHPAPILQVESIRTEFASQVVHRDVSFRLSPGTIVALIGGSGTGKTVLLREIIGLLRPSGGRVELLGCDVWNSPESKLVEMRRRIGVLFQSGALFSSLTVAENVAVPLVEQSDVPTEYIDDIIRLRLSLAGLHPSAGKKMPSELSGGMVKRASLARALALEPEILFLDEPTSGLDPINARAFDRLVRTLCNNLGITVFMVTHDLDTLFGIVDRVIVLEAGRVLADGPVDEVAQVESDWIREYFSSRAS